MISFSGKNFIVISVCYVVVKILNEKDIEKLEQQILENNKKDSKRKYTCPICGSFDVKIGQYGVRNTSGVSMVGALTLGIGRSGVVSCVCKECGHEGTGFPMVSD